MLRIICISLSEFFSSGPTQIRDPRLLRLVRDVPWSGLQLAPSSTIFEPSLNAGMFLKDVVLKVGTQKIKKINHLFYRTHTPLIGSCFSLLSPLFSLSPMILDVNAKNIA